VGGDIMARPFDCFPHFQLKKTQDYQLTSVSKPENNGCPSKLDRQKRTERQ